MRMWGRLAVLGSVTLIMSACGKKGSLVYPDMLLPAAVTSTTAIQSGSGVKIRFELPISDKTGNKLNDLAGVKINKSETDSAPESTCSSCMDGYRLFRKLYLDVLPEGVELAGNRMALLDGDVVAGKQYSYVIVPFTKEGMDGTSTSRVSVRIVQAALPPIIHVESQPTEIKLSFVSLPPLDGVLVGYNLYRALQKNVFSLRPINNEPINAKEYVDSGLARGTVYRYQARSLVRLPSGAILESLVSNEVEGMLKDDE